MGRLISWWINAFKFQNLWNEAAERKGMQIRELVRTTVLHRIWKIWAQMSISTSEIRSWRNKALPRFIYPVLDRGYRLWNMIIVSTLNSGERKREETLIELPFGENSKSLPSASRSKSSSGTYYHRLVVFSALACWCEVFLLDRQESQRKSFLEPSI